MADFGDSFADCKALLNIGGSVVSGASDLVSFGIKFAQCAGWMEKGEEKINRIDSKIDEINKKVDLLIDKIRKIETDAKLNKIKELDAAASALNNYISDFRNLICTKIKDKNPEVKSKVTEEKDAIMILFADKDPKEAQTIFYEAVKKAIKDGEDTDKFTTLLNNMYEKIIVSGISGEGEYNTSALFCYDERINNRYNWDCEAYPYREMYRIKLWDIYLQGSSLSILWKKMKHGENHDTSKIGKKYLEIIDYINEKHGADRKIPEKKNKFTEVLLNILTLGMHNEKKMRYSLLTKSFVCAVMKKDGKSLFDDNLEYTSFTTEQINEMSKRANDLGRTIKQDLINNGLIDKDSTVTNLISSNINRTDTGNKAYSNGSGMYREQIASVDMIDITKKNSTSSNKQIYNHLRKEMNKLFGTRVEDNTDTNETVYFLI